MFRKFSAIAFMMVMALLITLKHPVLGYCICIDSYFAGNCVCRAESNKQSFVKDPSQAESTKPSSCCSSCTSNLPDQTSTANEDATHPSEEPCDDCTEHLKIDVGDFVWNNTSAPPAASALDDVSSYDHAVVTSVADSKQYGIATPIRAGPSFIDIIYHDNVPLYLRNAVLRL